MSYTPIEGGIPQNLLDEFRNISATFMKLQKEIEDSLQALKTEVEGLIPGEVELPEFPAVEESQAYQDLLRETRDLQEVFTAQQLELERIRDEANAKINKILAEGVTLELLEEKLTEATKSSASLTQTTYLVSEVYAAEASKFTQLKAYIDATSGVDLSAYATITYVDSVAASIYGADVFQFTEIDARFTSVEANIDTRATITQLNNLETTIYGAAVSSFTNIQAQFNSVDSALNTKAAITYVDSAVADEASARASTFALLGAENVGGTAFILNQNTVEVTAGTSWASWETTLQASIDGKATITQWQEVRDDTDSILAKAGLQLNVNNHIIGWALNNNGSSGDMVIQVDKFFIVTPGDTPEQVFAADVNGVYINSAYIKDLTVDVLTAGTLNVPIDLTGSITIPNTGYIRSGQTAWNTGIGWWMGHEGGVPKFSIGNPAGQGLNWSAATGLQITGSITLTSPIPSGDVSGLGTLATLNSADYSTNVSGTKPPSDATRNVITSGTSLPGTATNGDLFYHTTLKAWYSRIGGVWVKVADETAANTAANITNQGALATKNTADYGSDVSGTKPPADATNNNVSTGTVFPSGGTDGDLYYRTGTTNPGWYTRIGGVWYHTGDVTQTKIDGGLITTGFITLNTGGHIKAGKANYADNSTAGFFLGQDGSTPKFNIGNATQYLRWTGSSLVLGGPLVQAGNISDALTFEDTATAGGIALGTSYTSIFSVGATTGGGAAAVVTFQMRTSGQNPIEAYVEATNVDYPGTVFTSETAMARNNINVVLPVCMTWILPMDSTLTTGVWQFKVYAKSHQAVNSISDSRIRVLVHRK